MHRLFALFLVLLLRIQAQTWSVQTFYGFGAGLSTGCACPTGSYPSPVPNGTAPHGSPCPAPFNPPTNGSSYCENVTMLNNGECYDCVGGSPSLTVTGTSSGNVTLAYECACYASTCTWISVPVGVCFPLDGSYTFVIVAELAAAPGPGAPTLPLDPAPTASSLHMQPSSPTSAASSVIPVLTLFALLT
jgi:hypothetical protein